MNETASQPAEDQDYLDRLERPVPAGEDTPRWGSDVVAALLRDLDIPYVALVPGSSFRGLHDSLVNYLGNRDPRMVLCLHEEHAVAIADGYGRATDSAIAVALHSNVGLMHAAMPIYNAWCDRVPMLIIGATGPVDAHKRRPWIDWVHTSRDQASIIRNYVKWDDQPASAEAAVESLLRAHQIASSAPFGPTYICLDVTWQEEKLDREVAIPAVSRFAPPQPPAVSAASLDAVMAALGNARKPLFMFGRVSRGEDAWDTRVKLAEAAGAAVITSIHNPAAFPTDHPRHLLPVCGEQRSEAEMRLVEESDLIVSFDWMDLAGYLRSCTDRSQTQQPVDTTVVHVSLDSLVANGWSMDHQALPAADINLLAHPDSFAADLLGRISGTGVMPADGWDFGGPHWTSRLPDEPVGDRDGCMAIGDFAMILRRFGAENDATFVRYPLGWPRAASRFDHPLSYLGKDGGAAVGVGPGHAVGAALALRNSGRLVTAVLGDGDTLMGINALWTASHLDLPLLIVVANNRSYFNDELHQERVATARGRPAENRWIGQRLTDPEVDICAMARAQGFEALGPLCGHREFAAALEHAAETVKAGGRVLIDARIEEGYGTDFGL
ncbi:thiamine pyrophosphate-binding protein [Oricola thermophila]|uniref:Thiamine pyrophosphate-binding protein n=1 Tax=Oricola thermophila TaxID=2742145 RepID=A0A6N1VIV5_9HYPH|nr:thiamine pyrophosphate-binding protein [Oricola thermophila]QKV19665.1 thiamine pyrophosphate-binding protein [Oricola thermophila]